MIYGCLSEDIVVFERVERRFAHTAGMTQNNQGPATPELTTAGTASTETSADAALAVEGGSAEGGGPGSQNVESSEENERKKRLAEESFPIEDEERKQEFISILDSIILGNFDGATGALEQFKTTYGGGPDYLYLNARLCRSKGDNLRSYEIFKSLYFEWPVFMAERRDYEEIRNLLLGDLLEKGRAQWNKVLAIAAKQSNLESGPMGKPEGGTGFEAQLTGELEKLLSLYLEILKVEPLQLVALKGLIHCYGEMKRTSELQTAQEKLREAQSYWNELSAKRAQSVLVEAKQCVQEGKEERIIQILNLGLETSPLHGGLLVFKAEILRRMGKFKEALQSLDALLRENESDAEGLRLKKRIQSERTTELISRGSTLLQEADEKISGSSAQKTKIKEALDMFYDALEMESSNTKALAGIYRGQMLSNNPLKAKKTLERIKEIDPRFQVAQLSEGGTGAKEKSEGGGCFVATRIYGPGSSEVVRLRVFREARLRPMPAGRLFIHWYNRFGPAFARLHEKGPAIQIIRSVVNRLVSHLAG